MTRFIALLAIVSGLLLLDSSKANDADKWCVVDRAKADEVIEKIEAQGFPSRNLDETNTAIFLSIVKKHEMVAGVPDIPGAKMVILVNPGVLVWGIIVRDDKWCARLQLPWTDYETVMREMKPRNI